MEEKGQEWIQNVNWMLALFLPVCVTPISVMLVLAGRFSLIPLEAAVGGSQEK